MKITNIFQLERKTLQRVLKAKDLFAIGYGDLGSSIYYSLGFVALFSLGATPISLALAGFVFLCTALTCAELASALPESGGTAAFTRYAFNDTISFLAGWGLLLDYIVTIAISSFAIAPYLQFFIPVFQNSSENHLFWHMTFTVMLIFLLYLLNVRGTKHSTKLSFILTTFTLITQMAIVLIAIFTVFHLPSFIAHLKIGGPDTAWSPSWDQFIQGTAMAMVAYTGIESIAQLGAEAKNPTKTIPRAVFAVIVILLFSYFSISITSLSVVSPTELGTTYINDPIAGIVSHLPFGASMLGPWVGLLAAVLLLVAANAGLIGASRLSFFMSEHYQLPRFLFFLHPRYNTPYITLALFAVLASIIVLASQGKMMFLADLYNFGAMIAFFMSHLSLIVLRIKKPDLVRPFKIPFNLKIKGYQIPISAILGTFATISVWILIIFTKPEGRYVGFFWMVLGSLIFFFYRRQKNIAHFTQIHIENVRIPEYKPLAIKNILVPTRGGIHTETVQIGCELARLHKAKITAVNILEIPIVLPIDSPFPEKIMASNSSLKRAEAIAREFNVDITLQLIQARSIDKAILEMLKKEPYDLIILGTRNDLGILGPIVEKILKKVPVRVWICKQPALKSSLTDPIKTKAFL